MICGSDPISFIANRFFKRMRFSWFWFDSFSECKETAKSNQLLCGFFGVVSGSQKIPRVRKVSVAVKINESDDISFSESDCGMCTHELNSFLRLISISSSG